MFSSFLKGNDCHMREESLRRFRFATNAMVLLERIELSTSPLPRECSASELQQRPMSAE